MSAVVWKFELGPWSTYVDMPKGARILSVGVQGEAVVAWALCDPESEKVPRIVGTQPTGPTLPPLLESAAYVGTVTVEDGIVLHIFDGGERAA